MKIQLLSDTHGSPYALHPEADVIAHAGDFGNGLAAMRQFQAACNEAGKPYVFVLGNHDYYHENMSDVRLKLHNEPYLRAGKTVQINGWTFSLSDHPKPRIPSQHCPILPAIPPAKR